MEPKTLDVAVVDAAKISPLDSPAVVKTKLKKAKKKAAKKAAKAIKKTVKSTKKAIKAAKKAEKKSRRAFSDADVAKHLSKLTTVRQLAKQLKVTVPAAQNYLNALKGVRKVETKEVRQGKRGPLAIAYRVG